MSVGGEVVEVIKSGNKVWINTVEKIRDGDKHRYGGRCAIFVAKDKNSIKVKPKDILWWQGRKAYWTTEDRLTEVETVLDKIGFSGVNRPSQGENNG